MGAKNFFDWFHQILLVGITQVAPRPNDRVEKNDLLDQIVKFFDLILLEPHVEDICTEQASIRHPTPTLVVFEQLDEPPLHINETGR
jgi:hypothetical protein